MCVALCVVVCVVLCVALCVAVCNAVCIAVFLQCVLQCWLQSMCVPVRMFSCGCSDSADVGRQKDVGAEGRGVSIC